MPRLATALPSLVLIQSMVQLPLAAATDDKIVLVNASCTDAGASGCSGWCLENVTSTYAGTCITQGSCAPAVCDPIAAVLWSAPVVKPASTISCASLGFGVSVFHSDSFFGSASTVNIWAPTEAAKKQGLAEIMAHTESRKAALDDGAEWRAANPQCDMH